MYVCILLKIIFELRHYFSRVPAGFEVYILGDKIRFFFVFLIVFFSVKLMKIDPLKCNVNSLLFLVGMILSA